MVGKMLGIPLVLLVALVLSLASTAAAAAAGCDPEVLAGCPLIPFNEFTRAFPVIQYCMGTRGFVAAERNACERFGLGRWTVRPGESRHHRVNQSLG